MIPDGQKVWMDGMEWNGWTDARTTPKLYPSDYIPPDNNTIGKNYSTAPQVAIYVFRDQKVIPNIRNFIDFNAFTCL